MQILTIFIQKSLKNADFGHQMALFENLSEKMQFFAPRRPFLEKSQVKKGQFWHFFQKKFEKRGFWRKNLQKWEFLQKMHFSATRWRFFKKNWEILVIFEWFFDKFWNFWRKFYIF